MLVWTGRRSLAGCNDAPVICGFTPLGDFLSPDSGVKVSSGLFINIQLQPEGGMMHGNLFELWAILHALRISLSM